MQGISRLSRKRAESRIRLAISFGSRKIGRQSELLAFSWGFEGLVVAEFALEGVQFHPESFLTGVGPKLLGNFLAL
ncbi:unnamed protein product [marine sediment metagenome]|uniref:Glutamine amidotransferase domain-containing protein n=1 Tax=marine sediment metagenome TaxID=412755 RepID=X1VXR1_9ZZZZ